MRIFVAACTLGASLGAAAAQQHAAPHDDAVPQEIVTRITAMLAELGCRMDTAGIEADDDGYRLVDVSCPDGRRDIDLDQDLEIRDDGGG